MKVECGKRRVKNGEWKVESGERGKMRFSLFTFLFFLFLVSCHQSPDTPLSTQAIKQSSNQTTTSHLSPFASHLSPSVTFILGTDEWGYNQYYTMANHYYRLDNAERTDVVVTGLTSLSQVFEWLRAHPVTRTLTPPPPIDPSLCSVFNPTSTLSPPIHPRGRTLGGVFNSQFSLFNFHFPLPYRLINLVSHGNEFIDLQATVIPHGARISAAAIQKALADSTLMPPDSRIVDSCTLVYLHGCAVGQNQLLLDALVEAFGGEITVKASKLFEYYAYLSPNHNPQSIRHYFARTWYAYYHPDSTVDEQSLAHQLHVRYPSDTVNWLDGLRRRFQRTPSDIYHYSFTVPVRYTEYYDSPEAKPSVNSPKKRQQWIDSRPVFRALIDSTRIPPYFFRTKFYRVSALTDDGGLLTGLQARAQAGVICLIQPLTDTMSLPVVPSATDTTIFAFSRKQK